MTPIEMKGLWDLLGQTWGSKFYEQYGPQPNDAWGMFLSGASIDAAKYALRKLVETGQPFAPTLPEFMAHARKWDRDTAAVDAEMQRLPAPLRADPEKTKAELLKLRQLIGQIEWQ
jgi:hypothetical protein